MSFSQERKHFGKVENAGYQHFLLFGKCFQNQSSLGWLNVGVVQLRVDPLPAHKFTKPIKLSYHENPNFATYQIFPD